MMPTPSARFTRHGLSAAARFALGAALALAITGCDGKPVAAPPAPPTATTTTPAPVAPPATPDADVPIYTYQVVATWPHDPEAFTQGLVFLKGIFLEGTGLNGRSTVRKVDVQTGRVLQQVALASEYFGEGITVLAGKIYQLTWKNQKGFVYDLDTLALEKEFAYAGEGWGLTTDGQSLILSDGTNRLRFIDPATFKVTRTIDVFWRGAPLRHLNELEFIKGEIYANIWQTKVVARLDPATGRVVGMIDFTGLLPPADHRPNTDVLNGLAYDSAGDRLFVTGKNWPKLFEVRLHPR